MNPYLTVGLSAFAAAALFEAVEGYEVIWAKRRTPLAIQVRAVAAKEY